MHRARAKIMAPSGEGGDNAPLLADPENEKESVSPQGTKNCEFPDVIHTTTVSVPLPSRSRTSSDGKIKLFSVGRSRSSSSKSSLTSLGSIGTNYWTPAKLYLSDKTVCYRLHSQEQQVCEMLLEDLVGVKCSTFNGGKACELKIHLFPLITTIFARKKVRRMVDVVVLFDKEENFKDNEEEAVLWKNRILVQANKASKEIFECPDVVTENPNGDDEDLLRQRYFLVLLNPMAGSQKGESNYNAYVRPMFELADIKCDVRKTRHQNYAHDLVQNLNLSRYDAIIISSGDGLLYEVINGLMSRPDWEEVIKIPIGMLPTGSGNALAASTLYESNEDFNLETAAFQIIRGGYTPLDLATVQTSDGETCYMTLLACWGIVADVDIESESMRSIGEARFVLGALNCIRKLKVYRGRVSYIVADSSKRDPEAIMLKPEYLEPVERDIEKEDPEISVSSIEGLGNTEESGPDSNGCHKDNSSLDSQSQNGSIGSAQEADEAAATNGRRPDQSLYIPSRGVQGSYGPPTDLLVPLSDKLPESWVTVEGDFLNVSPLLIPHMSRTVIGDPNFKIGTGKMRLLWIDGSISRLSTLKMFSDSETGKHVDMNELKLIDVKAFRIEPLDSDENGIMTVDGERVKYGPMQAQIHPHLAMVMTRRKTQGIFECQQ